VIFVDIFVGLIIALNPQGGQETSAEKKPGFYFIFGLRRFLGRGEAFRQIIYGEKQ